MDNSKQPIHPTIMQKVGENEFRPSKVSDPKEYNIPCAGLTKREHFAAMAMQGLLVNYITNGMYGNHESYPMVAEQAVRCADQLLKQLGNG